MNYEKKIREIISTTCELKKDSTEIGKSENLSSLEIDSIAFVELVVNIEDEFDIEFPDDYLTLEKAGTIKSLCKIVSKLEKAKVHSDLSRGKEQHV